jgi:hypothetical protein
MPALIVGLVLFAFAGYALPDFECRRCNHRWSEKPKREPD